MANAMCASPMGLKIKKVIDKMIDNPDEMGNLPNIECYDSIEKLFDDNEARILDNAKK